MRKISDETQQMVNAWLSVDWDPESREHVKGLVAAGKEEELVAHLGRRISFGTAGLRGKMKWGFAFMNAVTVTQASQGLCAYLRTVHPCLTDLRERGVIVGHDGRYNSRMFARLTAAVFLSRKIKVRLSLSFSSFFPDFDRYLLMDAGRLCNDYFRDDGDLLFIIYFFGQK